MKRYAYMRVSTASQIVDNQEFEISKYCYKSNITIDEWFKDEGVSGTVDYHKRNLYSLLKKVKAGDKIIVSEMSRLGRSLYMIFDIMKQLKERKIELYTIKENFTLDDSLVSKVMLFCLGLTNELESNLIRQRTKESLALRKAKGIKLGRRIGSKNKFTKLDKYHDRVLYYIKHNKSRYYMIKHLQVHPNTLNKYLLKIKDEIPESSKSYYGV